MILVTGGTGLLGGHLLLQLLQQGHKVRALIREEGNPEKVLEVWKYYIPDGKEFLQKVDWFKADIVDKAALLEAFDGVDKVYHCAALVSFDPRMRRKMEEVNVTGTRNIVNISLEKGIKRLVHVSSIAAIGSNPDHKENTEEDKWPVKPRSPYAKTKTDAEMEVWRGIQEGLHAVIVNPTIILGAGLWKQSTSRFFDIVYKGFRYYTLGATGFVDVEDVSGAMITLMKTDIVGERFILNGANLLYKEFFEKIAGSLGVKPPSRRATPLMTALAWRLAWLKSRITGKSPIVTRFSASSSQTIHAYSAEKYVKSSGNTFHTIDDTISRIAGLYLQKRDV